MTQVRVPIVTSLTEFNEMMDNNNNKAVRTKAKVRRIVLATQTGNFFLCDLNCNAYTFCLYFGLILS